MANLDVTHSVTEVKKTRKVKKTIKRRDHGSEITITEIEQVTSENDKGTRFCCWQCNESLTGQRYLPRNDHPYCIKCYENTFVNICEECNKIIGVDSKDLSFNGKHWHEACFVCNKCRMSLVGTEKLEYKTRQLHKKCFSCCVCNMPIGNRSFIPMEQEICCSGCYEDKYATRCVKCNLIITSGGVTYKNEPWHRECLTCTNCTISLAGQQFTSRDGKTYCAECFGALFVERSTPCIKPITVVMKKELPEKQVKNFLEKVFSREMCLTKKCEKL